MPESAKLRELKDLRIIASGIAVALILVDDLPRSYYGTFHDPGASAMLSIILANLVALLIHRGARRWVCGSALMLGIAIKPFAQAFFWIENATAIELVVLVGAHGVLGLLSAGRGRWTNQAIGAFVGILSTVAALAVTGLIGVCGKSWLVFWWQAAAARILVPVLFWTVMTRIARNSSLSSSPKPDPAQQAS